MLEKEDHRKRVAASRREEMQNRLLFSALVLAAKKSIHEIGIEEIIEHAQVSRGTFYKYFPSVHALFKSLAKQLAEELSTDIDALALQIPDPVVRLGLTTRALMRLLVDLPMLGKLIVQIEWMKQGSDWAGIKNMARDIEIGIKDGRFENMPTAIALHLLLGCTVSAIHEMLLNPPALGYEDKTIYHVLLGLGLDKKFASEIVAIPLPPAPPLPKTGIIGKLAALNSST
jgi:AcrR family transcriptional regulator